MSALPTAEALRAEFAARRRRVLDALGDGVLVLASGAAPVRSRDVTHRFRGDSDFLYLTGLSEAGAVLVLRPGAMAPYTLFVAPHDRTAELWSGRRVGVEGALADYGADAAYPIGELAGRLADLLDGAGSVYHALWKNRSLDGQLQRALGGLAQKESAGRVAPLSIVDPRAILHEMRLVKSPLELALMDEACRITVAGVTAGMARCRPGGHEFEVQAAIEQAFLAAGATGAAFPTIVGAGVNACTLHYEDNRAAIGANDMVLIDAGAEFGWYAGDASRTVPASGRFTPPQRALYDLVLAAEHAAIAAVRPGASLASVHDAAARVLTEGLVELGLLEGPARTAFERQTYRTYFMHRTSHWLGMDVHDVGRGYQGGAPRPLAPGMVLTVEPGLYVAPDEAHAPAEFRGLGIRIEDDVAVTDDGGRVLTAGLAREADEVAALARGAA